MGKQFGVGVTVKPEFDKIQLSCFNAELNKIYNEHDITYSSVSGSHSQINIQVKTEASNEKLFIVVKDILKKLKYDVVERKESNKKYLLLK